MKKFSNRKIENSLSRSVDIMASREFSEEFTLFEKENKKMKKNVRKSLGRVLALTTICLAFLVGYGSNYYSKNLKVDSIVTIDVNPSIKLSTNFYNEVIGVEAVNDDGESILENIYVKGLNPTDASNIIVDELIRQGYLSGDGSNVLLTIQNNDLEKAKEIEGELLASVNEKLDSEYIAGTVLTQVDTVNPNISEEEQQIMNQYEVSYGRAKFISNVANKDETLEVSDIANLTVSEMARVAYNKNIDMSDIVGHNGQDSFYEDKALVNAKKVQDEAMKTKNQASANERAAEEALQAKEQQNEEAEAERDAYEEAVKAREQAEAASKAARESYEEAVQEKNQGKETQNSVQSQNNNASQNGNSQNVEGDEDVESDGEEQEADDEKGQGVYGKTDDQNSNQQGNSGQVNGRR